jgi:hypothetical protein
VLPAPEIVVSLLRAPAAPAETAATLAAASMIRTAFFTCNLSSYRFRLFLPSVRRQGADAVGG